MKNATHKTKLLKHAYLKEEVEEQSELFSKHVRKFIEDFPEYSEHINNLKKDIDTDEETEEEEKVVKHKDLKKLYRRISKVTHPDKTNSPYLEIIFKQSSEDYQEERIGSLFSTATHLHLDTSDLDIEFILDKIDLEITTYEESIEKFHASVPWMWSQAKTEEEKDFIRKQFDRIFGDKE
tara:strand:- start:1 stop:540 length:540 start_codon:yes stop_codon:yes gene_type:complete